MRNVTGIALLMAATRLSGFAADMPAPATAAELFDSGKVWTVHLRFTQEQWTAMEPQGGQNGFGGMGRGGPGGGRGGFGPRMIVATAFLKGDRNGDGKISREEFSALGDEWFTAWDAQKQGKLSEEQLRAGLDSNLAPGPGRGPESAGGPGFGGEGRGPGGRGPGGGMIGANGRNGASAMAGIDFKYVHADLEFNGSTLKDVAVRYKGNSTFMQSRGSLKRSLKLDLNKYAKGNRVAGLTSFNLHSEVTDPASMNEAIGYRLFRDGRVPAPRTSYARVYVTVAGKYEKQYLGLYAVVEDIDKAFASDRFGTKDGAIFKPSTQSLFGYLGDDWAKYNQMYDPKTDLTAKQKQRVMDFAKLVTIGSDAEFAAQAPAWLDIEEIARYMALNVWLANMDSILAMGQNYYVYLDPGTNRFSILPWDLDLAFGGMGGSAELSIAQPWRGTNKFLERLYKDERFQKAYRARLSEFSETILKPEAIAKAVNETAAVIRPAVAEEEGKIERFDKSVAGEAVTANGGFAGGFGPGGPGGGPGGRGGPGGMPIKRFVEARAKSVVAQLAGKSEGTASSGEFGFGGRGGGRGGPGGMIAPSFFRAVDLDKNGSVSRDEMQQAFARWFVAWGGDKGALTEEQIRDGASRDLAGSPGFGPAGR